MTCEAKSGVKVCECCGESFICNANDIVNCFCYTIPLNQSTLNKIREKHSNCLCEKCLMKLSEQKN